MPTIDQFLTKFNEDIARPNQFRVEINFPTPVTSGNELFSFFCKSASLPSSQVGMITVPWRGRQVKLPGDRSYDAWSVQIINDNQFIVRDAFEAWSNLIANREQTEGSSFGEIKRDITVHQLDRADKIIKTYTLIGAWPMIVSDISLSYDAADTIEEFSVVFEYQYWKATTIGTKTEKVAKPAQDDPNLRILDRAGQIVSNYRR